MACKWVKLITILGHKCTLIKTQIQNTLLDFKENTHRAQLFILCK